MWPTPPPAWLQPWAIWRFAGRTGPRPDGVPVPPPPWAYNFLQWCEWKRKGSPPPKPSGFPKTIPDWAWVILKAINKAVPKPAPTPPVPLPPSPVVNKSFFTLKSSVDFTHPGGETENAVGMKAAGFEYCVLNVQDGATWEDWADTRRECDKAGVSYGVGGRPQSPDELRWQLDYALQVGSDFCVLNIENEFETTLKPPVVAQAIVDSRYTDPIMIDTVGWLYNATVYTPLVHLPLMLQVYQEDMKFPPEQLPKKVDDCLWHAREKGFTDIAVQFQSYRADPSMYAFWGSKPRNFFTGNVCGAEGWAKWRVPK